MELHEYPPLMTLDEAADFFKVKVKTVLKYGRERRIVILGTRSGKRVRRSSIDDYMEEKSEWHVNQRLSKNYDVSQEPARYEPGAGATAHTRRSGHTPMGVVSIAGFVADQKPRAG
jgi:hypothetical protein